MFAYLFSQPFVVHEEAEASLDDDAQHGEQIGQRSEEAGRPKFSEIRWRIGMVEPELAAIVIPPRLPTLQQHPSPGVVQLPVMQNHETRVAKQVGPHIVVARGVAELINDEIIWL